MRSPETKGMLYAGVGSRETPAHILTVMHDYAAAKARTGAILCSGGAQGADSAFEDGADSEGGVSRIYTVDDVTDKHKEAYALAEGCHPAWNKLPTYVRKLMVRNVFIVAGPEVDRPVDYVLAWTPNGCVTGGTGHTLRVARRLGVPSYNLHDFSALQKAKTYISNPKYL